MGGRGGWAERGSGRKGEEGNEGGESQREGKRGREKRMCSMNGICRKKRKDVEQDGEREYRE